MLVLTRRHQEAIKIGDDIEIKVLAIEGEQVKLGIEAPQFIDIHRKEVYSDIQNQNSEAANVSSNLLKFLTNEKNYK